MPHAALCVVQLEKKTIWHLEVPGFQCRTRLCVWCNRENRWMSDVNHQSFNAARGFVCGATLMYNINVTSARGFNAARGFVCGATKSGINGEEFGISFNAARGFVCGATRRRLSCGATSLVSMPHAALCVVQLLIHRCCTKNLPCFNAARGFVCGATHHYGRSC